MNEVVLVVIAWLVCGIASLLIAQARKLPNPDGWFVWGVLLGPIAVVMALADRDDDG